MAPKRTSSPPHRSRTSTPELQTIMHTEAAAPPATPGSATNHSGDIIMGAQGVIVPPSPGFMIALSDQEHAPPESPSLPTRKANSKMQVALKDRTGAGIMKAQPKSKTTMRKLFDVTAGSAAATREKALHKPFRFMDLPGEIRNLVYHQTFGIPKQALLVYRPRMASLRPRTRLDRQRTLASDIKDRELGLEISTSMSHNGNKSKSKSGLARETNRPFWGLTQVCHQLRNEFRPIYLQKQELGMDLVEIAQYLKTFYFNASAELVKLKNGNQRGKDMPFNGNLTIAVGDKPTDLEKSVNGIEVIPLLDLWANSFKIEAGFGRYLKPNYSPQTDGEAKDLYRLFGRRVLRNRQCSTMNNFWRAILRSRALASVTLHRKPASRTVDLTTLVPAAFPYPLIASLPSISSRVTLETKPYIHILFRVECAEPWMTRLVSDIPKTPVDWLAKHGFGGMEHFEVKVGVAPAGLDRRS